MSMRNAIYSYKQVTRLVVTEVRSESFGLVTERRHYNACPRCELLFCEASSIFHCRVWYRALSLRVRALCAYSTFGHHPHPLGYLCAKFRFCRASPLLS